MRKFAATACLTLLLLGCDSAFRNQSTYEGRTTEEWVELTQDENVEMRRTAVRVLGELGPAEADDTIPALAKACADPDAHVRLLALRSIEALAPKAKKAQAAVGRALSDKNKIVAKQAMKTLKAIELAKPSALNGH